MVDLGLDYANGIGLPVDDIRVIAANVIRSVLGLTGIVFMLKLLQGGFLMMTHGGDQESIDAAASTLTNAVIGLILVASSSSVARFVVDAIANATRSFL
ncbi:hypothetical protein HY633_03965 [Candidatus Uhrbacteria bacterium]|nr:hypothetical protein [Candidatus Uhrbacteria bacterium]